MTASIILNPMETAPKDGTVILIRFEHMNYQYADADDKDEWWELCEAKWIDHNGGGWTWHGIAGEATGWLPKPKQHYTAQPPAYDVNGELIRLCKRLVESRQRIYLPDSFIEQVEAAISRAEAAMKPACEGIEGIQLKNDIEAAEGLVANTPRLTNVTVAIGLIENLLKCARQHASAAIPPGYVLVPREPTDAMWLSGMATSEGRELGMSGNQAAAVYRAMIGAIPEGEK